MIQPKSIGHACLVILAIGVPQVQIVALTWVPAVLGLQSLRSNVPRTSLNLCKLSSDFDSTSLIQWFGFHGCSGRDSDCPKQNL